MHTAQVQIDSMLRQRAPFEHLESYIECRSDLPPDSKSALWLYAWVETDRTERRRCVAELLEGLAHDLGVPPPGCKPRNVVGQASRR